MKDKTKLGHQAPKLYRRKDFNSIELSGDFAYCASHNFVYNPEVEEEKLYNAIPCHYTDIRFIDTSFNFYKQCFIHWTRWKSISLKSCIRKIRKVRNIPIGTIVDFKKSYNIGRMDSSYKIKIKEDNLFAPVYEINNPSYKNNFTNCERSKELVTLLRNNGFIVSVSKNKSYILNMLNSTLLAGEDLIDSSLDGEIAIAYGHGKKIGFSSFNNDFYGYMNGTNNILWDKFGEFDKWSRCNTIPKTTSHDEILSILK